MRHTLNRWALAACFTAQLFAGQGNVGTNPAALAQGASALQQSGDYQGAADVYRALLKVVPNDVATHVNLGVVLVKLNLFDQAMAEYKAADQLLPNDPRIALNIALAYQKSGHIKEAATRLSALHSTEPENRQVTMLLADSRLQLGDNQDAIELLKPLASADETDLGLAYMLGLALLRTGKVEAGQVMLDRILRKGETAEAHYLLGTRMFESQDYPAAVRELAQAVRINPQLPQLQSLYGRALLNTGDPEAAREAFGKELAADPGDPVANAGLGEILTARREYAAALPLLRTALQLRPHAGTVELALATALAGAHQFAEALPYAQAALQSQGQSVEAHQVLSTIYDGLQQPREANRERTTARNLRQQGESAPHLGDLAPDFTLSEVSNNTELRLSTYRGRTPLVLVLGSYSCPNLRTSAETLRVAYNRYHSKAPFLLVYIREAHADSGWQSTRNQREGIAASEATTLVQRAQNATACTRNLHLPFTALADTMDGGTEHAYNAWPSRAFIIDKRGQIAYSTRLTDLDFSPEEFNRTLDRVAR